MIKSTADGTIEDTGPMTRKRMETADEEFLATGLDFIERAHKADKPFFVWMNTTRMHVWTRLKAESEGRTGIGLYPDGMAEHDDHVGMLLTKLDDLGIADNTIVIYSTDNGAETVSWPDGGITPFKGEKGTTWEGGFRVPLVVRWPGVIEPGSKNNDIISHEDWLPTLMAAVGEPDIVEKLKQGHTANGKQWKVHLDGYNFLPRFSGEVDEGPRNQIFYFDQNGSLNAVRWDDWKVHFATLEGNITNAVRFETAWPKVINLKADPYEHAWEESGMYMRWMADNMWLFVPIQVEIQKFLGTMSGYPFQEGMALNAGGINYRSIKALKILDMIKEKGLFERPGN